MAELSDARLEQLLRTTLADAARDLPLSVTPEAVLQRRSERRAADRRWVPLRVLAAAAALILSLAALVGIGLSQRDPAAGLGAVIVRGLQRDANGDLSDLEVIVTQGDGARGLVRLEASRFPELEGAGYPMVSSNGWLAFEAYTADGGGANVLVDLADVQREPMVLQGAGLAGWAPDGAFWRSVDGRYERIEPDTDERFSVPGPADGDLSPWIPGTWGLIFSADGRGIVVDRELESMIIDAEHAWGVVRPEEGGTVQAGLDPATSATGSRLLSREHGLLSICESIPDYASYCPGRPRGTVVSGSYPDRPLRTWGVPPGADRYVLGASYAADGGIWKLVDRRDGGRLLDLVHVTASGEEKTASTFAADPQSSISIDALAPDDSSIAIGWVDDQGWQTALVDTGSGVTRQDRGQVAGFVPSQDAVDWWPGGFDAVPGRVLPTTPPPGSRAYPALPPVATQTLGANAILLVHEGRQGDVEGRSSTETLGPIHAASGYGISLVCSGPGDVSYVMVGDPPESPVTRHCQDSFADGHEAPNAPPVDISIEVTADPGTAWRIVVYDPPPGRYPRR